MKIEELPRSDAVLAVDVMGADGGVETVIEGCVRARAAGLRAHLKLYGREDEVRTVLEGRDLTGCTVEHAEDVVTMDDKPTRAVRHGKNSSMWAAIGAVKAGKAGGVVSSGNTGALMAMSVLQLRMIEGVDRPAITATWPTVKGQTVVLDVGANVEASAEQLVQFAIMGEAYYAALKGKERPTVGLLNVGEEEAKGHALIREAARILREADPDMDFRGFVEGDDISGGEVDVVVTDGFTGNIALKAAEGTARMIGGWMRQALMTDMRSKAGAFLLGPALQHLKSRMNPSSANGAPLLGLGGLVVKSHGGADADGVASALQIAEDLAVHPFQEQIRSTIAEVNARLAAKDDAANEAAE
ncbi:phosphate acyltransferase PlsX [Parvularcula dongshanensis]|uniref:Phosphate acyltransferase n=1 Tax=Parvularcula dongshanensis TaxID=1173995 RepID=A0A840I4G8_9PROT|nr:glycerol-3-phosphate acyltransferase PlsX [Parvularcula dongshanensis]